MKHLQNLGDLAIEGHLKLTTRDAETGQIHEEAEGGNLITTAGLGYIGNAFIYALAFRQNSGWGSPLPLAYGDLSDCFGAIGTSSATPNAADIALGNEVARAIITNASNTGPTSVEVDCFFGANQGNGTITEAGLFVYGTTNLTTLTSSLLNGSTYTSLAVKPMLLIDANGNPTSIPIGSFFCIGYGNVNPTQYAKTTAVVNNGDTTISISAPGGGTFTANANYAVGTGVEYGPNGSGQPNPTVNGGILFDHGLLTPATVKTNTEVATLSVQLTLSSV